MYNPFPPTAGGALALTGAVSGANSIAFAVVAILVIIGGLILLRTAQMKRRRAAE